MLLVMATMERQGLGIIYKKRDRLKSMRIVKNIWNISAIWESTHRSLLLDSV